MRALRKSQVGSGGPLVTVAKYSLGLLVGGALIWAAPGCGSQGSAGGEEYQTDRANLEFQAEADDLNFVTKRPSLGARFQARGARLVSHGALTSALSVDGYELSGSAALSFRTRIDGRASDADWQIDGDHASRQVRPGLSEQVVALVNGTQTTWQLLEQPETFLAEIVLESAAVLRNVDADGLWFTRGEQVFKVSHASWLDAAGRHTEIPASYVDGKVIYRVPGDLLAESSYPAKLDPIVSAEFFSAPALDAAAYGTGIVRRILERPNGDALYFSPNSLEVRGVDPTDNSLKLAFVGTALFPDPFAIRAVDLVMLGDDVAFAWIENGSVQVRRVDLTTLDWKDAAAVTVSDILNNLPGTDTSGGQQALAINTNGSQLLVTWADAVAYGVSGVDVGYALLDASTLAKVGGGFLKTTSAAYHDVPTQVVVDDNGVLGVAATDTSGSSGQSLARLFTLDAGGSVSAFELPADRNLAGVAGLGSGFAVVYEDSGAMRYQQVTAAGAASGAALSVGSLTTSAQHVARIPGQGVLLWTSPPRLVSGSTVTTLSGPSWYADGSHVALLQGLTSGKLASARYEVQGGGLTSGRGSVLSLAGTTLSASADYPVSSRFISKGGELATAYDATTNTFFVIWNEETAAGLGQLRMAAFDPFSNTRKFGPITLHTQTQSLDTYLDLDAVGMNGQLVVKWALYRRSGSSITIPLLQRFDATDGSAVDSSPVALSATSIGEIGDGGSRVTLAWGGNTLHASWFDSSSGVGKTVTVDVSAGTLTPTTNSSPEIIPYGKIVNGTVAGYRHQMGSAIYGTALTVASKVQDICTTSSGGVGAGEDFRDGRLVAGAASYFAACGSVCEIISPDGTVSSKPCTVPTYANVSGFAAPHFVRVAGSAGGGLGGGGGPAGLVPIAGDLDANWRVNSVYQDGTQMPAFGVTGSVAEAPMDLRVQRGAAAPGAMLIGYLGRQVGAGVDQVMLRWIDPGKGLTSSCTTNADCASGVCTASVCAEPVSGTGGAGGTGGSAGTSGSGGAATGGAAAGGSSAGGAVNGGSAGSANGGSAGSANGGSAGSANGGSGNAANGGSGNTANGGSANGGSGNAATGGAASGGAKASEDDGGCGCATPGSSAPRGFGWLGLAGLGLLVARRRRRS